ncbi:hypothetical protein IFM89_017950 [Coptis chinensis]|uniref:Uncharacterized protein n=1 Tax=Coptis chinensis TaxID=261450 RepID=A0A835HWR3_9MAGN|nr:hypothetical protein IFM89_017950 [Coptis chinensis]
MLCTIDLADAINMYVQSTTYVLVFPTWLLDHIHQNGIYDKRFATIFLVPFAFMFERDKAPPLSFIAFSKMFMLSLFGITICLNVYGISLVYTFAMLAAGTANTLHVITFLMAVLLR